MAAAMLTKLTIEELYTDMISALAALKTNASLETRESLLANPSDFPTISV
jgi:hypothetical protein